MNAEKLVYSWLGVMPEERAEELVTIYGEGLRAGLTVHQRDSREKE